MTYKKGDRVKLSARGVAARFSQDVNSGGTVVATPFPWKKAVRVRWDGRKSASYWHHSFIALVEATATGGGEANAGTS